MALNQYYEDELSYLREMGDIFARETPKLAGFLSRQAEDPDVERLLEGFAFLTARLRQRLDDEMPEVVHGLIQLLWPHYLRPVPPITMLAFDQGSAATATAIRVSRGTSVRSRMIDGVSCAFSTAYDVDVLPLRVAKVDLENRPTSARLDIKLQVLPRGSLRSLSNGRLRLHFATEREPLVGRSLYLWMLRHATQIIVRSEAGDSLSLAPDSVAPVGLSEDEAVLPAPSASFAGFRLIQEYLSYPDKFLFVDINGLAPVAEWTASQLTLSFEFRRPLPNQIRVADGNIRLNCTPAVNLFAADAQPLRVDGAKAEYRLQPGIDAGLSIHAVEQVTGYMQGRAQPVHYVPFESFRHDLPGQDTGAVFYRLRVQPSIVGRGVDHYLAFVNRRDQIAVPQVEVVSVGLTCSNGRIAERLAVGSIDQAGADVPSGLGVANIAAVVSEVPPPISDGLLWRLVANLARNFGSIIDAVALRGVIASYDFRAVYDAQARRRLELLCEGLIDFNHSDMDWIVRGRPLRMRAVELLATESKLGGEAELFLFGSVIDAFFNAFASINSLHRFSVRGSESNVVYAWPPRPGAARPL
ncbi:MAG: type VI secretion system baseplate subunit TssF [Methylovirgula sp.]